MSIAETRAAVEGRGASFSKKSDGRSVANDSFALQAG